MVQSGPRCRERPVLAHVRSLFESATVLPAVVPACPSQWWTKCANGGGQRSCFDIAQLQVLPTTAHKTGGAAAPVRVCNARSSSRAGLPLGLLHICRDIYWGDGQLHPYTITIICLSSWLSIVTFHAYVGPCPKSGLSSCVSGNS